ncbi:unnamed protein product [Rotaria sp. Silwood2]|nr:unnamed protein product [Rotaria sp. Silwood2]CAF3224715.1 unnamed protein product [Rotaria sp. Silwood2]CAF4281562.1 unnamed protein product [Rotaria sp. Silwood2]CAF4302537.1 unnamed protein product [Rotaria sp. Silwood2]CAF4393946.1 unnamed protein product [Rotaria sp. Silwood2]
MCRCTQTSIPYSQFVSLNSQFHQVCSSDFVSEEWFSSLFNANTSNYYPLDFRLMASAQFQVLSVLCRTSRQAVIDAVHGFAATTILSPNAMSRDVLNSYVGTSIEQFQKNTLDSFGSYYHFVSSFIEEHRFISALRTNFYTRSVPGTNISVTFSAIYPQQVDLTRSSFMSNETCLCDRTSDCVYPAGIYNQSRAIIPNEVFSLDASPLFIVPGFQVGCVPQNALLQSTLECFYNQSCLDIVISLTGALRTVSALNISNPFSRFSPTTTIGVLFDNIMIESWENSTDFATYFQTCAPKACSYSYVQRFFLIYMITTMASVFGGLSVVFRTMSPLFVKFILCLCRQRVQMLETNEGHEPKRNFQDRIWNSVKLIYHKTTTLNLFKTTFTNVQHGVYATRVYSILLMLGIYILTIYSSSTVRPQQIIVRNPSLDQFEHLYDMYSSKLSCPCRYSSIIRSTFISNEVQIHPFCTSSFVRDDRWFQYWTMKFLNGSIDPTPPFYWTDFRKNGLRFFNYVKIFCDIANISIVVGCSIMSGLSHSTFECFYDDVCINQLNRAFGISFTKFNLNETQFLPTTPIGSILDEYSVVSVNYSANYSAYFQICAPSICQYHYIEQRNVVYIFTTLLGLYGGLTAGLHIFVWYLVDLYRVVFNRCSRLLQRVHPSF